MVGADLTVLGHVQVGLFGFSSWLLLLSLGASCWLLMSVLVIVGLAELFSIGLL